MGRRSLIDALAERREIVQGIVHDTNAPAGAERPGRIAITLVPGAIGDETTIDIRFPPSALAGHVVTLRTPEALLSDLEQW